MRRAYLYLLILASLLVSCQFATVAPPPTNTPAASATALANPTTPATSWPSDVTITIGGVTGATIHPLLGVNVGPAPAGQDPNNADLTQAYQGIGVNLIRTHDFYGPLDMAVMYPDRTRDPANPQSYDLRASDAMWRAIVGGGFEPYLRLGDSWNNARPPANAQERANWVRASVAVVRHYRQGQWNGFTTPFRYVEIWNEPDNLQFWPRPHTAPEYFQLYVETARALKQAFPDLLVGGPGLTPAGFMTPPGQKWCRDFLAYVKKNQAPLDFFSWHLYSNDPHEWVQAARFYRGELDALGFQATAMHVTEWNTAIRQLGDKSAESLALRTGGKGAAILTAAWIAMQDQGITVSTFYRGSDPAMDAVEFYGIFYANGQPKRIALAFALWAKLAAHPQRLAVSSAPGTSLWLLAGQNDAGEKALLIANPTTRPARYTVAGQADRQRTLLQVSDASAQVQSLDMAGPVIEIGGETVQLLTIAP